MLVKEDSKHFSFLGKFTTLASWHSWAVDWGSNDRTVGMRQQQWRQAYKTSSFFTSHHSPSYVLFASSCNAQVYELSLVVTIPNLYTRENKLTRSLIAFINYEHIRVLFFLAYCHSDYFSFVRYGHWSVSKVYFHNHTDKQPVEFNPASTTTNTTWSCRSTVTESSERTFLISKCLLFWLPSTLLSIKLCAIQGQSYSQVVYFR